MLKKFEFFCLKPLKIFRTSLMFSVSKQFGNSSRTKFFCVQDLDKHVLTFGFNVFCRGVKLGFRENKLTIFFSILGVTLPTEIRSGKVVDSFCHLYRFASNYQWMTYRLSHVFNSRCIWQIRTFRVGMYRGTQPRSVTRTWNSWQFT